MHHFHYALEKSQHAESPMIEFLTKLVPTIRRELDELLLRDWHGHFCELGDLSPEVAWTFAASLLLLHAGSFHKRVVRYLARFPFKFLHLHGDPNVPLELRQDDDKLGETSLIVPGICAVDAHSRKQLATELLRDTGSFAQKLQACAREELLMVEATGWMLHT
eukprot:6483948-Amphidinium_carterae.1